MPDYVACGVVLQLCELEGGNGVDVVYCEDDRGAIAVMAVAGVGNAGHLAATAVDSVGAAVAPGVAVVARLTPDSVAVTEIDEAEGFLH